MHRQRRRPSSGNGLTGIGAGLGLAAGGIDPGQAGAGLAAEENGSACSVAGVGAGLAAGGVGSAPAGAGPAPAGPAGATATGCAGPTGAGPVAALATSWNTALRATLYGTPVSAMRWRMVALSAFSRVMISFSRRGCPRLLAR